MMDKSTISVEQLDALLPQTQCGDCSYDGCQPYAKAIVEDNDVINRCLPGGLTTLHALADVLKCDPAPYEAELQQKAKPAATVVIREEECIGCTKCITACPVDAIVGRAKRMHSVIQQECTGCGLCIAPCPMDCIDLIELAAPQYDKNTARQRHQFRQFRLQRDNQEKRSKHNQSKQLQAEQQTLTEKQAKQEYIRQAIARVQEKRKDKSFHDQGVFGRGSNLPSS